MTDDYQPVLTEDGWMQDPEYIKAKYEYDVFSRAAQYLYQESQTGKDKRTPVDQKALDAASDVARANRERTTKVLAKVEEEAKARHKIALDAHQLPVLESLKDAYLRDALAIAKGRIKDENRVKHPDEVADEIAPAPGADTMAVGGAAASE